MLQLVPSRFVTLDIAAIVTGYTRRAMEGKIADGVWVEGRQYVRAPDGRTLIDLRGYEAWASSRMGEESNSRSPTKEKRAGLR